LEGTFKLADAGIDTPNAPDVVVAAKWKTETMKGHMPGTLIMDGMDPGQGTHGSLSRFDIRNTLIANGPDFKPGYGNKLPSANSDVAPTVAMILSITPTQPMDGRVLSEALRDAEATNSDSPQSTTFTAKRTIGEK